MDRPDKDFAPIESDYAFFMEHATESDNDLNGYRRWLDGWTPPSRRLRFLDFGCGPGNFTERFLELLPAPPEGIEIALVDPVASYRQQASERLKDRSSTPLQCWDALPDDLAGSFDLILANHVFYYVPELPETLAKLVAALKLGGRLLTAIAGRDNALVDIWFRSFPWLGMAVPYQTAEDVENALKQGAWPYRRQFVPYQVNFPDTTANREALLRFLLAEYFERMPREELLGLLSPYAREGRIAIETGNLQFAVEA